jgi:hypothetical protein
MANGFESWIDKQIREAQERGEFDSLPGTGRPIPDRGELYDDDWWIKQWVQREEITGMVPTSLKIRKEAEDLRDTIAAEPNESTVRRIVASLNERIDRARRGHVDGPPVYLELSISKSRLARRRTGMPSRPNSRTHLPRYPMPSGADLEIPRTDRGRPGALGVATLVEWCAGLLGSTVCYDDVFSVVAVAGRPQRPAGPCGLVGHESTGCVPGQRGPCCMRGPRAGPAVLGVIDDPPGGAEMAAKVIRLRGSAGR